MDRLLSKTMKILMATLLLGTAHADPAEDLWPEKPFKHVVAYCYNPFHDERGSSITFDDGTLSEGVIRATTVRLDEAQTTRLRKLLSTDTDTVKGGVLCYDPHHAFVFYDADWKVTASIDICFLCSDYRSRPEDASGSVDLSALMAFCRQLGLPILKTSQGYTKLFYQEQPPKKKE